jgi:HEAT repeat protein
MKLDLLLLKPEGMTPEDLEALRDDEIEILRTMATREDPAFGVTHQVAAIGALGERMDAGSLLLFTDLARDRTADDRVRIAAIHALGEIGGPAVDTVVGQLVREKRLSIRAQAVRVLAKVGTAADIARLEQAAGESDEPVASLAGRAADALRARLGIE